MLYPVKNAEAFAKGDVQDFSEVGVKALDDTTLVVTLNAPTPYFLQLMDHYSTFAVHPRDATAVWRDDGPIHTVDSGWKYRKQWRICTR